jgi:hypothetical protein
VSPILIPPLILHALLFFASFCDRDMIMRFRGGGVGHSSTRDATNHFLTDRHPTDLEPSTFTELEEPDITTDEDMGSTEAIPDMAAVLDNDCVDDEELADRELGDGELTEEAEGDYGYGNGESDDGDDGEEDEERQGLVQDEADEDEVEQLGFARF